MLWRHTMKQLETLGLCPETSPQPSPAAAPGDEVPRKLHWEITTECNLDCRMCIRHVWDSTPAQMNDATADRLLEQIEAIDSLQTVQFGGFGEPTTHLRLLELIDRLKRIGRCVELITNGTTLAPPLANRLIDLGLDRLIVSMDAAREPTGASGNDAVFHDECLPLVQANLRTLHLARVEREAALPEVAIEFVASRRNIHQLPELKRMAFELGFSSILVTNLLPYTPDLVDDILYRRWLTTRRNRTRSHWYPAVDLPRVDMEEPALPIIRQLATTGTRLLIDGAVVAGGGMSCRFINEGRLAVTVDGGVSPCLPLLHDHRYFFREESRRVFAHRVGNVNRQTLSGIWDDAEYRAFRDRVRRFEFSPCIDCGGCDLREDNRQDCFESGKPTCGECLWAAGVIRCP